MPSVYLVKVTSYIGGMSTFTKYVINVGGAKLKQIICHLIQYAYVRTKLR